MNKIKIKVNKDILIQTYIVNTIKYKSYPFFDIPDYKHLYAPLLIKLIERVANFYNLSLNKKEMKQVLEQLKNED